MNSDIIGQRFGNLVVIAKAEGRLQTNGKIKSCWLCACDCGGQIVKLRMLLNREARARSDNGCKRCEAKRRADVHTTHGGARAGKSRLFTIWKGMRSRCNTPSTTGYKFYGARGITVCPTWDDFAAFRDWSMANGYKENLTIDRIDPDGNYEPTNCEWVTLTDNSKRTWSSLDDNQRRAKIDYANAHRMNLFVDRAAAGEPMRRMKP